MGANEMINSIIEFFVAIYEGIMAAFKSLNVSKGYEDPKYDITLAE